MTFPGARRAPSSLAHLRRSVRAPPTGLRLFSATRSQWRPSNVGNLGLAEEDAQLQGQQTPEPLTLDGIRARREKAGKLVAPTASYSDSDMFKSPHAYTKPNAKRWDDHLSKESLARTPCILKQAAKYLKKPGMISLGGGLPSAENFPFDSLSMRVPQPPHFGEAETAAPGGGQNVLMGKRDVAEGRGAGVHDLSIAMNYGQSIGSAQLLRWVTEHTELVCTPPYADWRCALTIGSTGALDHALRMFCDRARGDSLLVEEFSFSTALETAEPLGIHVAGARMDEQGLIPESVDEVLTTWDPAAHGGARKPSVLYTVPSGQNPTGATQGAQRRRDLYQVCQKHDLYIIEDEPYYFLQLESYKGPGSHATDASASISETPGLPHATPEQFLDSLLPSLLSMDVDGRVLRMDSFSKLVAPGTRLGWITASEQVVERYIRQAEVASQGPAGVSQLLMYKLVDETWGHEGYLRWLMHLSGVYTRRRNAILDACERCLPKDVVSWTPPAAGMFLWLKLDHTQHPDFGNKTILEIEADIFERCIERGVLAARGSWFRAEPDRPLSGLYFRTTFAAATEGDMSAAIERFNEAVRGSFQMS